MTIQTRVPLTPAQYILTQWLLGECWQDRDGWARYDFLVAGFIGPEEVFYPPTIYETFIPDREMYLATLELLTTKLGVLQ